MAVSVHQEFCQSIKHLRLYYLTQFQCMQHFDFNPSFQRVFLQVSGLSSSLCKGLRPGKKEICRDLYSLPVFLKLSVFLSLSFMSDDLSITTLTDTSFPFLQRFLLLFLLRTYHHSYLKATFQLTSCLKKIINTPFPTFSCHLVACNTQGLIFQNLFELQLLIHFWKAQGWIKLLIVLPVQILKGPFFVLYYLFSILHILICHLHFSSSWRSQ